MRRPPPRCWPLRTPAVGWARRTRRGRGRSAPRGGSSGGAPTRRRPPPGTSSFMVAPCDHHLGADAQPGPRVCVCARRRRGRPSEGKCPLGLHCPRWTSATPRTWVPRPRGTRRARPRTAPGPAAGTSPRGALSATARRLSAAQIADLFWIDYFFNPSTARFAGSVAFAGIPPPPRRGVPSLIAPVLFECRRVARIGLVMSVTGIRGGEGSSGGLLPSPDMQTYC